MGMFDYINHKMKCPKCGANVSDFQSKDGSCTMNTLEYWEVDNFYTLCDNCDTWIEFNLKRGVRKEIPLEDYEMSLRK